MSTYDELLATVKVVRDRTGDPNAWQTGLTPTELAAVITPTTRPDQLAVILAKIRQQHPNLFGATPADPRRATDPPQGDREQGAAAEAIAGAEAALAHQNSASSQLDLQVISAIMNAHLKTVEGAEALNSLQRETEAAVRTRSDLDTPAGARDFQRFLIGKLRDIRAVVMNASLDDTSKSALMAAWTSLYDASKSGPSAVGENRPASVAPVAAPARQPDPPDAGADPLLDSLLADDPGLLAGDSGPTPAESAPAPAAPSLPGIPNIGLGPMPGPGSMAGWGPPGGLPLPGRQEGSEPDPAFNRLDDEARAADAAEHESDDADKHKDDHGEDVPAAETPPAGPTTVTLPDGETVTAASPQLAAAVEAAVGGASIPDAFHQQGITIPAPGTAVADPVDPVRVAPGDIGIFTDRHALGLGHSKALLDGQIQHIASVSGPSFLGWEHPPAAAIATAPARTDAPTPTRPAATPSSGQ
ncbi:DUF4226 domain-containing protein [Mycobacterium sp. Aquia_216]|uniref:DUF4226 domain-containing protein n=1 Tax=Mycobacterium sp. Aquia_216 TaxID=2991729 RepID=UPI00227C3886|nr:DUF4226 domain-containing protein [Mycobacterium sp. Aquia_216]WAJ45250.1 DUF4226 domain-containing protein [Mycobacterium sp. Aquia_216]